MASRLVKPHEEYMALGIKEHERLAAYRTLFCSELDSTEVEEVRAAVNGGFALA